MDRSRFSYELPAEQIAQEPLAERSASRLLVLHRDEERWEDARVRDLPRYLQRGDLMVFNDTRVIRARLLGRKASGGRVELLLERFLDPRRALVQLRASKPPPPGSELFFADGVRLTVLGRRDQFFEVAAEDDLEPMLAEHGHVPLPPYIRRDDRREDEARYQTVYARNPGAVAAPTAGLHFDQALLDTLAAAGIAQSFLTLHVGAGTFQPVRVDQLEAHRMHSERYLVPPELARIYRETRAGGGRVLAVGTTVLRTLEAAWEDGGLVVGPGETDLFIHPGGRAVRSIDALLTNFHLPESTLLMLVCALAGIDFVLAAYRHAVGAGYRFFSYGDAMLVL